MTAFGQIETRGLSWTGRADQPSTEPRQTEMRWYWNLAIVCAATALIFSRQPDALLHAQFFAEDGKFWFADAYNDGRFISLFKPQDGYFQTLPRLAAALSMLVPLVWAPLVMNLAGLVVQVLPIPLLLSSRLWAWGTVPFRAMLAFTYLALPNCAETNVTIEEGQWHLAFLACLLLVSPAPANGAWKTFDMAVFALCGLTGPFAILLTPIAALRLWFWRDRFPLWPLFILSGTAAVQVCALLTTHREHWPLGASVEGLVRIMSGQVFLGTILGSNWLAGRDLLPFLVCVAIVGSLLTAYCFVNASYEWKLFLLFSATVLATSLCNPFTPGLRPGSAAWTLLSVTPGIRYWFFPTLAFAWTIVWYLFGRPRRPACHLIGFTLMVLMTIGFIRDWRIPARKDAHFASYVKRFNSSAPGTVLTIPENPDGWTMRLVRR